MTGSLGEAIQLSGVVKSFGRSRALRGMDLVAGPGVTGLLGRNGAGKTTLMRILATVLAPDKGTVRLLGHTVTGTDEPVEIRRRLGYLPQEPGYYPHFTAFEFVDYVAILKEFTNRRERHDEVRRVLHLVDLDDVAHRHMRKLSGGMRRRVGIAQALLGDPHLLILDEPTAGLDPEQRLRFRDVISGLGETRAVVLATHQTEDVAALCGQVAVINEGRSYFVGSPGRLTSTATGRVWTTESRDPTALVAWRTGTGTVRNLGVAPPAGAHLTEPTLEDAYLLLLATADAEAKA